jgi:hypothetical protein
VRAKGISLRDQEGKISDRETRAASLVLSVKDLDEQSEIVKVERIHPSTGEVLTTSKLLQPCSRGSVWCAGRDVLALLL